MWKPGQQFYGAEWMASLPIETRRQLQAGQSVIIGNKVYAVCSGCAQVICVNKTFFGSVHFCREDDYYWGW